MNQKTYIAFDQYQRYQTIANVIEYYRQENPTKSFKVLEIGSNEHKDLRLFLPNDKIVFTDITLTETMKQDQDFQQADGTNLQFENNSFDFVVAADVLEHVPDKNRPEFCNELKRVANIATVICFPYMTQDNINAEERLNVYYRGLYGSDFIWLKEHNTYGLPSIEHIDYIYEKSNSHYFKFYHGNLKIWEQMWYCHFNTCGASMTEEYRHTIDHYYNNAIYNKDIKLPCYRVFYICTNQEDKMLTKWINEQWQKEDDVNDSILDMLLNNHQYMSQKCKNIDEALSEQTVSSTLYWAEAGQSYNEENIYRCKNILSEDNIHIKYSLSQSVNLLRFDPMEKPCIVEDLHIYSNVGSLQVIAENGIEYQGKYVFLESDPRFQIIIDGKQITSIDIRAHITPIDFPEYEELLNQLFDDKKQMVQLLAEQETAYKAQIAEQETVYKAQIAEQETAHKAQIAEREKVYQNELKLNADKLKKIEKNEKELLSKQKELEDSLSHYMMHYHAAIGQREELKQQIAQTQNAYNVISNAFFWKITKPARMLVDFIKMPFRKSHSVILVWKGMKCLKQNGFKYTWRRVQDKLHHTQDYLSLTPKAELTQEQKEEQKNYIFSFQPKFSIVVPLYNTPEEFLHEMIQSVLHQTYGNWELCMADGSDYDHKITREICHKYMKKDKRIKYKKLTNNEGISKNTIEAYTLATGDYIVLMDHDDILTEDALFECARCIEKNPSVDFIYSDKGIFEDKTNRILAFHYLPDYSPEFLRATNYASHLNLFSRNILDKVGFIREGYDGSQDYDIELRVVEKARSIQHIAKVLYYCRACEGSVALNPESKMYAYEAGRRAIEEHIARIGYPGRVEFLKETFSYRIHYNIVKPGKVSIIIPNKDHIEDLKTCIESILKFTDYEDYEIVVVENNSECADTFTYYREIEKLDKVKVLYYYAPTSEFNYSAINNYAVDHVDGKYVLFLNNDTKVINKNWLTEMLMYAQRDDVGAVGAKLYYPDHTYQHIGLFIGMGVHIATHYAHRSDMKNTGYMHRLSMPQNYNAVTAACLLIKREDFLAVYGFDAVTFKVGLNDIDLCLKLREMGKYNVLTPYAELYHYESISRKSDEDGPNKERFERERKAFRIKWSTYFEKCDEYYNPNLHI